MSLATWPQVVGASGTPVYRLDRKLKPGEPEPPEGRAKPN
jgi:hypothetical protein